MSYRGTLEEDWCKMRDMNEIVSAQWRGRDQAKVALSAMAMVHWRPLPSCKLPLESSLANAMTYHDMALQRFIGREKEEVYIVGGGTAARCTQHDVCTNHSRHRNSLVR